MRSFLNWASGEFGKKLDAVEGGGHPHSFSVSLLDADHGGLAEGPAAGTQAEAGRQHDDQFELRAGLNRRVGIEEDSGGTEVAGLAGLLGSILGTDLDWHAGWLAILPSPFWRVWRHGFRLGCSLCAVRFSLRAIGSRLSALASHFSLFRPSLFAIDYWLWVSFSLCFLNFVY